MAIVNLIIKPFICFVLYRIYQDRGGQYSDFGIAGIPGMPNLGGGGMWEIYLRYTLGVWTSTIGNAAETGFSMFGAWAKVQKKKWMAILMEKNYEHHIAKEKNNRNQILCPSPPRSLMVYP